MARYKVEMAESPTRVMNALAQGPVECVVLRDEHGATSADLSLLSQMGLIVETGRVVAGGEGFVRHWALTVAGAAALRPASPGRAETEEPTS